MTYDERQEIVEYLDRIDMKAEMLMLSVRMLRKAMNKKECVIQENKAVENAKDKFLKQY